MVHEPRLNTLVCWETRNEHRINQAKGWCRDFGLNQLMNNIYLGRMSVRERNELYTKFQKNFIKNDAFHFITLCRSCFNSAMISNKDHFDDKPPFEIIG